MVKFIPFKNAKVVDLGTKTIRKYTSPQKDLEVNIMTINGRHPENPDHFIFEKEVDFFVYIINGTGKIWCNEKEYSVKKGDAIYVSRNTKYAVEGNNLEYLTAEHPAWFPEQAFIVDKKGKVVEDTKI